MPEIILRHVTKRFGKTAAVDDLNMVIEDNAFITLLGPSGCGKTTTLRMIAGLETPTEGEIWIGGEKVFSSQDNTNVPPNKRDVGFLFQNYALWPHMTVRQNIAFGLENLKWEKPRIAARVEELTKMLKIQEYLDRYPSELSGGQQQRVAIARTLAPGPKVLFMDEPLSNLDAKLRTEMRAELKRLHVDTDSTFVYVTHDQLEAMTLSSKVCLMEKGVLQQYAPPLTMYLEPENLFVADFMGSPTMNFIPGRVAAVEGKKVALHMLGAQLSFQAREALPSLPQEVVVGVRPEFITLNQGGGLPGKVYSTLPAGMETTVRVSVADSMVTSVVFGGIDYPVDSPVNLGFTGGNMLLFDPQSGKRLAMGSL